MTVDPVEIFAAFIRIPPLWSPYVYGLQSAAGLLLSESY